jgi:hypothetical protein
MIKGKSFYSKVINMNSNEPFLPNNWYWPYLISCSMFIRTYLYMSCHLQFKLVVLLNNFNRLLKDHAWRHEFLWGGALFGQQAKRRPKYKPRLDFLWSLYILIQGFPSVLRIFLKVFELSKRAQTLTKSG